MNRVSRVLDRLGVVFDDENLVANAGLLLVATLSQRLGMAGIVNSTLRMASLVGGAHPARKVLTLVHTIVAGGSHIDHAEILRAGDTARVLGHRVMAPSTLGTSCGRSVSVWSARCSNGPGRWGRDRASPGSAIDVDSTICEVGGKKKGAPGMNVGPGWGTCSFVW